MVVVQVKIVIQHLSYHQMIKLFQKMNGKKKMDNIKNYSNFVNENLEVLDDIDINIDDKFENELSDREKWDLERYLFHRRFTKDEILKLNLYFGIYTDNVYTNRFPFTVEHGKFGEPVTRLKGIIEKKKIMDSIMDKSVLNNGDDIVDKIGNGEIDLVGEFYMVSMDMLVKVGRHKGHRKVFLYFKDLKEFFKFLDEFKR